MYTHSPRLLLLLLLLLLATVAADREKGFLDHLQMQVILKTLTIDVKRNNSVSFGFTDFAHRPGYAKQFKDSHLTEYTETRFRDFKLRAENFVLEYT